MARITVEDCLEQIPNRFQLVLAATYRARMLSQGHTPRIESKNKPGVTALREIAAGNTDPFYQAKLQTARFYFAKLFPETATLMRTARAGSKVLMDTDMALA